MKNILREEVDKLLEDIIEVYENSGKKTTGEFAEELEAVYNGDNSVSIWGVPYLAGRKAGKMPPVKAIEDWIRAKGITPIQDNISVSSLAWAIAKKITKEGTNPENHLPIYDRVITPQRIQQIIDKVSQFHVALFVDEITVELTKLTKNI